MRLKEIGIRKVLGSSVLGIVRLLSGEFTKMILIAIFIALPLSYLITKKWLDDFAYRINLEWWYFYGAALCTLTIALCTVSYQSIKAALINPAKSLRAE
jgi:putative ABC transport system permease protein